MLEQLKEATVAFVGEKVKARQPPAKKALTEFVVFDTFGE